MKIRIMLELEIYQKVSEIIYSLEAQNRDLKKEIKKLNEKLDSQKFDIISAVTKKQIDISMN